MTLLHRKGWAFDFRSMVKILIHVEDGTREYFLERTFCRPSETTIRRQSRRIIHLFKSISLGENGCQFHEKSRQSPESTIQCLRNSYYGLHE